MDARRANNRIADKAEQLRFVSRVPMLCECSAPDCRTVVLVGLAEYREIRRGSETFLTSPGHDADRAKLEKEMPGYDVRRVSRRRGDANGDRRSA
jgi:hypothetical protein